MKDAYYFSHDSNARHDPDILSMVSVYGMAGYGWYWVIIEILRDEEDYKFNITKEHSYNAIAMQLYCDCNAAKKFIEDCINEFDLFVSDGENFWSESLLNRMSILANKRQKMKDNADKRWSNQDKTTTDNAIAMQKQCKSNASKVKESKVKESKDIYAEFVKLTKEEHQKLTEQFGVIKTKELINNLSLYIGSKGDKYKSHYHTILMWEKKNKPINTKTTGRKYESY